MIRTHIRWLIKRDLPDALDIERASFARPWTEEDFLRCLRQRNCIGMVAEDRRDRIVGYMLYELHKTKLHLLNFAVHPDCRRQRVGEQMVFKLVGKLSSHRRTHIDAAVRESNTPMHLFLRACDFWCHRIARGFYLDTDESAYLFRYTLDGVEVADAEEAEARA